MRIRELFDRAGSDSAPRHPYIVAEVGVNHEGRMDLAVRLVEEAGEAGADAVKFQSYKAESLATKSSVAYWDLSMERTQSQFELFKRYDRFWKKEYEQLKVVCDRVGVEFLSTPFDKESAGFLSDLVPAFKIASADITNKPFIEYVCNFGKPILLSTGASYMWEISRAVEWIESRGQRVAILHCVLSYPTQEGDANLGMIQAIKGAFPGRVVGYSDHTLPGDMKTLEVAALLGAQLLEKHFTFDKTLPGNDHYHAMDKEDLKALRRILDRDLVLIGSYSKVPLEAEAQARLHARRSLVAALRIPAGKVIEYEDLTYKRPGTGISPAEIESVLGMRARTSIEEDTILQWSHLE